MWIVALVLVLIALAGWRLTAKKTDTAEDRFRTQTVDRGDVATTVTAAGTVSAVTTVQVGSQVSGVIAALHADFNSPVHKGQLLAELDPTPFQAQVEQREADLRKAEVDLQNNRITLERSRRLVSQGLSSEAELDSAKAVFGISQAQVEQARAALDQSRTNLGYTRIVSPIDGVVVARQYDVGQTVAASFQAPTLFTIAQDLTQMQVQADVDQADIGRVAVGQKVRFTVDAYPEQEFRGRISQIRLNATVNQNVVTYPVIVEVPNPDEKLRPTMTANVVIEVARVQDVLRVPNSALRFKPETTEGEKDASGGGPSLERRAAEAGRREGGMQGASKAFDMAHPRGPKHGQTVYKLEGQSLVPVEIQTGISDGRYTAVTDGALQPGDTLVVGAATAKASSERGPGMRRRF